MAANKPSGSDPREVGAAYIEAARRLSEFQTRQPARRSGDAPPGSLADELEPIGAELVDADGNLATRLRDGTAGYHQAYVDNCMQAAVATCLQVPLAGVPYGRVDARVAAGEDLRAVQSNVDRSLKAWAAALGLRIVMSERVPLNRKRWIGGIPGFYAFGDHAVVMSRSDLLFDPAAHYPAPVNLRPKKVGPDDVKYGVAFERIKKE